MELPSQTDEPAKQKKQRGIYSLFERQDIPGLNGMAYQIVSMQIKAALVSSKNQWDTQVEPLY